MIKNSIIVIQIIWEVFSIEFLMKKYLYLGITKVDRYLYKKLWRHQILKDWISKFLFLPNATTRNIKKDLTQTSKLCVSIWTQAKVKAIDLTMVWTLWSVIDLHLFIDQVYMQWKINTMEISFSLILTANIHRFWGYKIFLH